MSTHDQKLVTQIIPFLQQVKDCEGLWVAFQVDQDREFQAAMHWLTTNTNSPYLQAEDVGRRSAYVLEWANPDWTWGGRLKSDGVWLDGERVGRMRYRTPRKKAGRGLTAS